METVSRSSLLLWDRTALKSVRSGPVPVPRSGPASLVDNPPAHNDFAAWAAKYQIFYNNQQEYEHNYQSRTITRQLLVPIPTLTQPRSSAGDPIDLDLLNKMKAEERQRCYINRLCFYCKAPGHDIDNCEKKKIADARRFSGQTSRGRAGF